MLQVYDVAGELVAKQQANAMEAQNGRMGWDGGQGRLGSGIYVVMLSVDNKRYFGKLAILEPGFTGAAFSLPGYLNGP